MSNDQSGFTITEVVVSVVLVAIMITVITGFGLSTLASYSINTARAELLGDARLATDIMNRDIRLSANVDEANRIDDANAPGAPDNTLSWQSGEAVLVLATAAEDGEGNILFADASNYVTEKNNLIYYVVDGELRRRVLAADVDNNSATTTCPPDQATEGCPADSVFAENVAVFQLRYVDRLGEETTLDNARAVEVVLELAAERYSRVIEVKQESRMVFRND